MELSGRLIMGGLILLLLLLLIPPLRSLVGKILTPALTEVLKGVIFGSMWFLKSLWGSHLLLLKSLLTPKKLLFPSLSDDLKDLEDERHQR